MCTEDTPAPPLGAHHQAHKQQMTLALLDAVPHKGPGLADPGVEAGGAGNQPGNPGGSWPTNQQMPAGSLLMLETAPAWTGETFSKSSEERNSCREKFNRLQVKTIWFWRRRFGARSLILRGQLLRARRRKKLLGRGKPLPAWDRGLTRMTHKNRQVSAL
ncbi:hypothetical protein SEVIR_2G103850v4 [Setaria viridis]